MSLFNLNNKYSNYNLDEKTLYIYCKNGQTSIKYNS